MTFDQKRFTFDGSCEYVLSQVRMHTKTDGEQSDGTDVHYQTHILNLHMLLIMTVSTCFVTLSGMSHPRQIKPKPLTLIPSYRFWYDAQNQAEPLLIICLCVCVGVRACVSLLRTTVAVLRVMEPSE